MIRDFSLIVHFIGLAMGLGASFGFMFLGNASGKMQKEEGVKFRLHLMPLGRMGRIGLTLLVISGLQLMTPYWSTLTSSPLLMAKLVLTLMLALLIGIISSIGRKAGLDNNEIHLKKIEPLGKVALLTGLAIVILAVSIFH